VKELLVRRNTLIAPPPQKIMWFYKRWQPLYTEMRHLVPIIEFVQGIPPNIKRNDYFDTRYPTLFVIDDLMKDATQSTDVCELFTEGSHHRNLSVICLLQNLYYKGKESRTMSLNAQYMVLFKNPRDQQQVSVLARQMYPGNTRYFMEEYQAATQKPYGCLFIDLKQNTPEGQRLKYDIFQAGYKKQNSGECHHLQTDYQGSNISENIVNTEIQTEPQLEPMATFKENQVSCMDCGSVYASPMDLRCHVKRGCPEADSEDDSPPTKMLNLREDTDEDLDDDDDDDDPAFEPFINDAYDQYDKKYQEKVDQFLNEGLSKNEAKKEATDLLRPKYRKAVMKSYSEFLETLYYMKHSPLHYSVWKAAGEYFDKGKNIQKAVTLAVEDHKHKIGELLQTEESDEEEEEEEEDGID